ncbi:imidazoleglycerol-phosphate dehydratase 1, chloroplastic [Populus alba]|uniref:Imidazoleglycerol-phosphate dehydratase n=1 Tax=Populus alba x Populus x berolinensis TaxID=444605 RepID=A0AAD6Q7F8_9ROSI|nr:imidazoleglycerol-phosphate dehydratase 1, chloroplastic [Populus alba]KAJ6981741.1 imidazoleglycerol-phosphate dehydratase 1 [Populus alba x Populus x berolinensis]
MEVSGFLSRTSTFSSPTKPRRLPTTTISHTNLVPTRIHYPNPIFSSTPLLMDFHTTTPTKLLATPLQANGSSLTTSSPIESRSARIGEVKRVTKETNVFVKINLDGTGIADSSTGIPFLDHMLDQLSSHGLFDLHVRATGDIHIDDHHTNEDVALAVGTALLQALGDRKGINRFGDFSAPLDEALIHVSLDLSGRPYLGYDLQIPTQRVGTYDTQLVEHFFQSLVNTSGMTLHIRQLAGRNSHHIIEATFKAFARALRQATEYDPRRLGTVPSSKGVLSRS